MTMIQRKSPWSGVTHERDIDVDPLEFENWKYHWDLRAPGIKHIQDAFPQLNPGDREFLFSGITPEEWALDEINARRAEGGRFGPVESVDEFGDETLEFQYGIVQRSKVVSP